MTETPNLVGLGGKLRAGKDEAAKILQRDHGYVLMGMSDILLEAAIALNAWITTEDGLERFADVVSKRGYVEAKKNPEVRRLLQALGTEVGRNIIDSNVWVKLMFKRIDDRLSAGEKVAITAMRFPNELEALEDRAGVTIWIDREDSLRIDSKALTPPSEVSVPKRDRKALRTPPVASEHASEASVNAQMFQYVVQNNGTLDELGYALNHLLVNHAESEALRIVKEL